MIKRSWYHRRSTPISCHELGKALQSYLDANVEPDFADKIASHLEACKDCGLEAETYQQIKLSLAAKMPTVDPAALDRLRRFGEELTSE